LSGADELLKEPIRVRREPAHGSGRRAVGVPDAEIGGPEGQASAEDGEVRETGDRVTVRVVETDRPGRRPVGDIERIAGLLGLAPENEPVAPLHGLGTAGQTDPRAETEVGAVARPEAELLKGAVEHERPPGSGGEAGQGGRKSSLGDYGTEAVGSRDRQVRDPE